MQKLLKNRNFMLLWCGQTISGLGTWINFVGLNLYIYSIFGSGKILGLFMVARMLPALLFGPLGGYLADRYSRRTIMIICDSLRAVLVLGFLLTKDIYSFFILGFVLSALDKIFMAANSSIVPNIVESEDILHANSITRMSHSVITVLGPAAGGLLIAMFTYKIVFIIDSITFIISVITAFLIKYSQKSAGIKKKGSLFTDFKETFAFFAAKSTLFYLVIVRFIDAFGSGAYNTSLPIFSKLFTTINISLPMFVKSFDLSRSAAYGWLVGAWALGEFSGSFAVGKLMKSFKISSEKMFSFSVIIMALGMGITFRCHSLIPAIISIFIGGVGDGISNVVFNTTLMKESPDEIRGRVFGSTIALVYTTVALGMAAAGFFIDRYPLGFTTDWSSLIIIIGVIAGFIIFNRGKAKQNENILKY